MAMRGGHCLYVTPDTIEGGRLPRKSCPPRPQDLWGGLAILVKDEATDEEWAARGDYPLAHDGWRFFTVNEAYKPSTATRKIRERVTISQFLLEVSEAGYEPSSRQQSPRALFHAWRARDLDDTFRGRQVGALVDRLRTTTIWLVVALLGAIVAIVFFGGAA